ncbi:MAG: hypothetical protein VX498_11055 [Myxococcota bacterium]|nr:hypothetical protein [Myxococcota bacterium]
MRTLFPSLLLGLLLLAGCALHPPQARPSYGAPPPMALSQLRSGDLVVALARGKARTVVTRVHQGPGPRASSRVQVHAQQLFTSELPVRGIAASTDGRWIALETGEADGRGLVQLWDLMHAPGETEPRTTWSSPEGCSHPDFEPRSQWMLMSCPAVGRQPNSILRVDLPSLEELHLVGETPRLAPAVGMDGNMYWVEDRDRHSVVMRRAGNRLPFVTHDLSESVQRLWPQADGSLVAELARPGRSRSFARLSASGVARVEAPPVEVGSSVLREASVYVGERGVWSTSQCDRGLCSLRWVSGGEEPLTLNLGAPATAVTEVPWWNPTLDHPEDLATAPASVLASHPATRVAVLGVSLGMALQDAFTILDKTGRHPYWIESRTQRHKPRGVGVGWTSEGHCIEYLSDERGVVTAVDLKACAASYVSPALRPLLDRSALASDGGNVARRFLGPGVAVTVGGGSARGHPEPIRRTELVYTSAERGYHFEARSEVLPSSSLRVLGGWVWLRLQLPGRRQTAVRRP